MTAPRTDPFGSVRALVSAEKPLGPTRVKARAASNNASELRNIFANSGTAGAALFARSREVAPVAPTASHYVARQKITLASGSLRKTIPIDEEIDPDDGEATHDDTTKHEPPSST